MKIHNKVHNLNPDVIDLKRLERETYKFLYLGLVVAVLFHAGILFLYPAGKTKIADVKNIQVELVKISPRITRPIIISKSTSRDVYRFRRKTGIGVPSAPRGLKAPSGIECGEIKMQRVAPESSLGKITDTLSDSIIVEEIRSSTPKDNVPLKNEVFIDTGEYKSMLVFPPDNKMAVQGYTHIAMAFGANLSPNDSLNYSLRNLAELVNFYTNIKASGEDVWLYKSSYKVLSTFNNDKNSRAVGSDGSFTASRNFPQTYNYDPSKELSKYPLIYISYDKPFILTKEERANLREYIKSGGFIILDNPLSEKIDGLVTKSLKKALTDTMEDLSMTPYTIIMPDGELLETYTTSSLIPARSFIPLQKNHEIFHCFFDFDNGHPGGYWDESNKNNIEGIYLGGRLIGIYTIGYGLSWQDRRNEEQLKMGVNMVVYALKQGKGKYDQTEKITMGSSPAHAYAWPGSGKMINLSKGNVKVW